MTDLKPCPFCGRIPTVEDCGDNSWFVRCKCGIAQDKLYAQRCSAIKAWNRRYGVRCNDLPSAQPTIYGYNIEHLELIARVLQKEDLPPERVAEALTDIGRIVAIVKDEFEEELRKMVEQWMI